MLGVVALSLFGLFTLWTVTLRRQVARRTRSLSDLTSHLQTAFDAARGAVLVSDRDGVVSHVNREFHEMFGSFEIEGRSVDEGLDSISARFLEEACFIDFRARSASCDQGTVELRVSDPERIVQVYSNAIRGEDGEYLGEMWSFEDVTERRRLEEELTQAQKMEAVGQLSSAIAHDFNNLLAVVSNSVAMIQIESERRDLGLLSHTSASQAAIRDAAELIRNLLDFSRRTNLSRSRIDARTIADRVSGLIRRVLDCRTKFDFVSSPTRLPIHVDSTRIVQVLINLCINARDALEDGHGSITLTLRDEMHAEAGACACFEVRDDGCGMDAQVQRRIFEPFFSTKARGAGTGLGLSMALGLVQQHGGLIECHSQPKIGTTFRVLMPLVDGIVIDRADAARSTFGSARNLRILIVDDDAMLRRAARGVLQKLGHSVIEASSGGAALEILADVRNFDAILLDLTMPGMSGVETLAEMRTGLPDMPVVVSSGYSTDVFADDESLQPLMFLPKPYGLHQLVEVLHRLTAAERPGESAK